MLLTDPPYGVDYVGKTADAMVIQNDSFADDVHFLEFLTAAFANAKTVMNPGAAYYIWHADSAGLVFRKAATEIGKVRQCLIWNKNSLVIGRQDYQWKHEPCLYGWNDDGAHTWYSDRAQTTVLDYDRPNRNGEHPTMKPVELFAQLINNSTKPGDLVLDLFGGSGTTIVTAEQLGRKCYMMEIDPHYCDVIIARWEKLTGKTAVKTN